MQVWQSASVASRPRLDPVKGKNCIRPRSFFFLILFSGAPARQTDSDRTRDSSRYMAGTFLGALTLSPSLSSASFSRLSRARAPEYGEVVQKSQSRVRQTGNEQVINVCAKTVSARDVLEGGRVGIRCIRRGTEGG